MNSGENEGSTGQGMARTATDQPWDEQMQELLTANKALARANVQSALIIDELQQKKLLLQNELHRYFLESIKAQRHIRCAIRRLDLLRDSRMKQSMVNSIDNHRKIALLADHSLYLGLEILDSIGQDVAHTDGSLSYSADLMSLLLHLKQVFEDAATDKNIRLRIVYAADLPADILFPLEQLEIVVTELFDNSMRHSRSESLALEVKYDRRGADAGVLEVVVSDDGCGVTQDTLLQLEEILSGKGRDGEMSLSSGMGYALLSKVVELTHSHLYIQSSPGKGFKATLLMPGGPKKTDSGESAGIWEQLPLNSAKKLHVFLVADPVSGYDKLNSIPLPEAFKDVGFTLLTSKQNIENLISNDALRPACVFIQGDAASMDLARLLLNSNIDRQKFCFLYLLERSEVVNSEELCRLGIAGAIRLPISDLEMRQLLDSVLERMKAIR